MPLLHARPADGRVYPGKSPAQAESPTLGIKVSLVVVPGPRPDHQETDPSSCANWSIWPASTGNTRSKSVSDQKRVAFTAVSNSALEETEGHKLPVPFDGCLRQAGVSLRSVVL